MCQYRSNCHYFVSVSCTLGPASLCRDMKIFKDCRSIQFTSISFNFEDGPWTYIFSLDSRRSKAHRDRTVPSWEQLCGNRQVTPGRVTLWKADLRDSEMTMTFNSFFVFSELMLWRVRNTLEQECGMVHASALVQITFTAMSSSVQQLCHSQKEFHCYWCARKLF